MLSTKLKEAAGNSADATLYVDDVFSTYLYNGLNATQTITTGIDLATKGGLLWLKGRNVGSAYGYGDHELFDSANVGSTSKYLRSDGTDSISAGGSIAATPFTTTGFNLKAGPQVNNRAGDTTVAWTFRKAAKFFDVVTYTGTGSARTIAHSLGVAPGMVIVKRTDTSSDWQVYHRSLTSAAYSIQLNLTNAQASAPTVWNSTAPTSSVFSVGTDATVNASGGTYVAYLYAHDTSSTGIIQCGSYVGNGLTAGPNITLGWEPQYVLRKNASNARGGPDGNGSWDICDSMRGMSQTSCPFLLANSSAAEDTSTVTTGFIIPNATGFVDTYTYPGDTYIYMAIRMPNKPPTTGTQVFGIQKYPGAGGGVAGQSVPMPFAIDMAIDRYNVSNTGDWDIISRLQGLSSTSTSNTRYLNPHNTNAEASGGYLYNVSNASATIYGFSSATTQENYLFKRAPGFFDVVCYTGNGATSRSLNHNLGVTPELIIVKNRSSSADWKVSIDPLGLILALNSTGASGQYTGGYPSTNSSTLFDVIGSSGVVTCVNTSSSTYVAYLFATLAEISKVGSYTGNGTTQNIECGFAAGARFVLIKRTDSTGDWYTFDSARGLTSGSSPYLLLNSTAAEVTGNNGVYASTGGFTLGATASTTTNINAATYIFLAVA